MCICLQSDAFEGAQEADGDDAWEELVGEEEETNGAKGVDKDADDPTNNAGVPEPGLSRGSLGASLSELEIDVDVVDEEGTVVENSQESGRKYWALQSSISSFEHTTHLFVRTACLVRALHCARLFVRLLARSLISALVGK